MIWACSCPQVAWGAERMEEEDFNHRFRDGLPCTAQPQAAKEASPTVSSSAADAESQTPTAPTTWRVRLLGITSSSVS